MDGKTKTISKLTCQRCGHEWWPATLELPKTCPRCKSYRWMEPKTRERRPQTG